MEMDENLENGSLGGGPPLKAQTPRAQTTPGHKPPQAVLHQAGTTPDRPPPGRNWFVPADFI